MWADLAARPGGVAVVGLGASGSAAVTLLRRHGCAVYASDAARTEALEGEGGRLRALGAMVEVGGHDLDRIAAAGLVVVSPGVPPDAPPVVAARLAGREVWAEAELGLRALAGRVPFVAVTGTNGKTTTTSIAAHLLAAGGRKAVAVGNIGPPVSAVSLGDLPEAMAVELSSFQLHDMPTLRPTVGVLTNLAPDHLDRYPSLAAYYADKERLFSNAGPGSVWVGNADDADSRTMLRPVAGRHLSFSLAGRADGWLDRTSGTLRLGDEILLARTAFPLLGDHNVANALAASLAANAMGRSLGELAAGLASVRPLAHRLEPVGERRGVVWINDSKATNVASTAVAIAAMERPFVLLLGGRHKGEPYTRLAPALTARCRAVVTFGEAAQLIAADLGSAVRVVTASRFDEVLATAARLAEPGDAVLLSPACSSFDMFANYVARGERFRSFVETDA